ncbi:MAG TPA: DNA cytosine methyltransferase, partial [Chroococcales cyanobacterium]
MLKAIEFYSGIGAFADACRDQAIDILAAFDQSQAANLVYETNFKLRPRSKNLDTIKASEIPDADLWWLSPPCTPFTVRGNQRDLSDPRANSFANLVQLIPQKLPAFILIENVTAFKFSRAHKLLTEALLRCRYQIDELELCPTAFGVPMRRPRHFMVCRRGPVPLVLEPPAPVALLSLKQFLKSHFDDSLVVDRLIVERYEKGMNIVVEDDENAVLICFTRGYWRCRKASGSMLALADGRVR